MKNLYVNINPNKLHDELIQAGFFPVLVENDKPDGAHIAPNTWLTFEDSTDMTAVQVVIDAHDPTPIVIPDPDEEIAEAIQAATTLSELKAALLGNGKLARVKGKMK